MLQTVKDLPEELVESIKAFTDERRRKIFLMLLKKDSSSYSEIQKKLRVKKGTLNHHLDILVSSGLIRNFSIRNPENPYKSYYAITDFGQRFLEGIRNALEPNVIAEPTDTSSNLTSSYTVDSGFSATLWVKTNEDTVNELATLAASKSKKKQGVIT